MEGGTNMERLALNTNRERTSLRKEKNTARRYKDDEELQISVRESRT